jgi:hypothetical protein
MKRNFHSNYGNLPVNNVYVSPDSLDSLGSAKRDDEIAVMGRTLITISRGQEA